MQAVVTIPGRGLCPDNGLRRPFKRLAIGWKHHQNLTRVENFEIVEGLVANILDIMTWVSNCLRHTLLRFYCRL